MSYFQNKFFSRNFVTIGRYFYRYFATYITSLRDDDFYRLYATYIWSLRDDDFLMNYATHISSIWDDDFYRLYATYILSLRDYYFYRLLFQYFRSYRTLRRVKSKKVIEKGINGYKKNVAKKNRRLK